MAVLLTENVMRFLEKGWSFLYAFFIEGLFPNINKEQYNFLYFSILNTFLNNIFRQGYYFFAILYLTKERKYTRFITIEKGDWRVKYQKNPEDQWLPCVMVFIGSSKNGRDQLGIYHVLPRIKIISFVWFIVFLICFLLVFLEFFEFFFKCPDDSQDSRREENISIPLNHFCLFRNIQLFIFSFACAIHYLHMYSMISNLALNQALEKEIFNK